MAMDDKQERGAAVRVEPTVKWDKAVPDVPGGKVVRGDYGRPTYVGPDDPRPEIDLAAPYPRLKEMADAAAAKGDAALDRLKARAEALPEEPRLRRVPSEQQVAEMAAGIVANRQGREAVVRALVALPMWTTPESRQAGNALGGRTADGAAMVLAVLGIDPADVPGDLMAAVANRVEQQADSWSPLDARPRREPAPTKREIELAEMVQRLRVTNRALRRALAALATDGGE